jgi:predicted extracellular nuclease
MNHSFTFTRMNRIALLLSMLLLIAAVYLSCGSTSATRVPPSANSELEDQLTVGFYNLENLFDTTDDASNQGDNEYLPSAAKHWTSARYQDKLAKLSTVISQIGNEVLPGGPALLGVCEVENKKVLEDLVAQPALSKSNYAIIHYDSPDGRGIDNALLYRKDLFTPTQSKTISLLLDQKRDDGSRKTTRDVLYVKGALLGDTIHYLVNHWPSRYGGEEKSRPGRAAAALLNRKIVDSIEATNKLADIIIAGDLNDDPNSPSLTKSLKAAGRRADAGVTGLYNPMLSLYNQGGGTLGYQHAWNLFDQIIVSEGLAKASKDWMFRNARIFRKDYLLQQSGSYKGFPFRTYVGSSYKDGYSDHLPVYAVLIRPF